MKFIDKKLLRSFYRPRPADAEKRDFGHALILAGGEGKAGAAVMCVRACLRSGAGLTTCRTESACRPILQAAAPEAMLLTSALINLDRFTAAGAGPGMGTSIKAGAELKALLTRFKKPTVLDADALNLIALHKPWLKDIPPGSILTPHAREFDRLFGDHQSDEDRVRKAIEVSGKYPFCIVLKKPQTLVAWKGEAVFNDTGNPGLAKGGSGDVLTGMVTALLAQGYTSREAAILGVWLHGTAADLALKNSGQSLESLVAGDVIAAIGQAYLRLVDR